MAALATLVVFRVGRQQVAPAIGAAYSSKRDSSNLATFKRGRGGRSSFSGIVATVLGSSGFLGRVLVNKLGKTGSQVICPYRGDPYAMRDLRLAGDLGQILFLPYQLKNEDSLRKVMQYSNVVINLVGRDWDTKNFSMFDVHHSGASRIARIARESGVQRFIHFSSLNAQPKPSGIFNKEGSKFFRSKFHGEVAVREEFPDATIFRPADVFGAEDRFIRYYASAWRRAHGTLPLWKKGNETVKMPVFCSDVAEGVINAIYDEESIGQTYECIGPEKFLLADLADFFYRCMRFDSYKRIHMTPVFRMKVAAHSLSCPNRPILHSDKLEREHLSDELTGCPTLEDLGVRLTSIIDRAPFELKPFRSHRYYEEAVGEFADPEPPPVLA